MSWMYQDKNDDAADYFDYDNGFHVYNDNGKIMTKSEILYALFQALEEKGSTTPLLHN